MSEHPDTEEILNRLDGNPILFELIPPPHDSDEELHDKREALLRKLFSTVNVGALNLPEVQEESKKNDRGKRRSDFPERLSPREYVRRLSEPFPDCNFFVNRVIVKKTETQQKDWLEQTYHDYGIENVILVGGESSDIDYPGPSVLQGNRLIKKTMNPGKDNHRATDYRLGNICIAGRRSSSFDEPDRMIRKIRSGADFFTTQIVFEAGNPLSLMEDLSRELDREKLAPPFLFWSFSPVAQQKDIDFLRWLGITIPDEVEETLLQDPDPVEASINHARKIWEKIQKKNQSLPVPFPLGINVSFMGDRNFQNAIRLSSELEPLIAEPVC